MKKCLTQLNKKTFLKMTRGYSLVQDLRSLLNDPKYGDLEILCKDGKKLYGCRVILAARSEVLNGLLYNGMKESYENQITFPEINFVGMEIILEFIYTGSIKDESIKQNNIVEAYYAADYFQLFDLKNIIVKIVKNVLDYRENYSPELLSKVVETMPLMANDDLLNLLFETVATTPLNTIEFGRLSINALHYLLFYMNGKEKSFATPEYEVFRYSAILAAKKISNNDYKTLVECLPTLKKMRNSINVKEKVNINHQKIIKKLNPLIKFIDFRRIKGQILVDIIEPLGIVSDDVIVNAYRYMAKSDNNLKGIRGIPSLYKSAYVWDDLSCGSKLIIEDNGRVVRTSDSLDSFQGVKTKMRIESKGIFEWNIIIEKNNNNIYIGFSTTRTDKFLLRSDGYCNGSEKLLSYCPPFKDGTKVTIHLNNIKRTCAFTVNGIKYPEVPNWNKFPGELHPIVILRYPCRLRIQEYWL
jgi:hypothetical protein